MKIFHCIITIQEPSERLPITFKYNTIEDLNPSDMYDKILGWALKDADWGGTVDELIVLFYSCTEFEYTGDAKIEARGSNRSDGL